MKKFSPRHFLPFGKKTFKKEKKFYQVSIKLRILMAVEFFLLTSAYLLILFFYLQNCHLQQNTSIYNLNHTLLLHANSVLEKLDTASGFPLAHMADRYNDPLLKYLVEKNHGGITQTDFYRFFYNRTNEVFIQFPEVESIILLDKEGNLLDSKTVYNLYLPAGDYSSGAWYENCREMAGKLYILNEEEVSYLGWRQTPQNLHAARILYDHLTLRPICITLIGIRAADIPITFETEKLFDAQQYAIYDSSCRQFIGNLETFPGQEALLASRSGDYYQMRRESGTTYLYHISYSSKAGGSYSVIRTPYRLLLWDQFRTVFGILVGGLALIVLNISIFGGIIGSINRPLARLVNMCEEIGHGNFSIRIPCSQTDELSYLTDSLNSMSAQVQQLIEEVYIRSLTERDLELQMLRSQINPHFLYNTLENMRMSAYTQGYLELSEMCLLLSKVLRYGVTNQSSLVCVKEELEHLKDYTALLQYCLPQLQISICVDEKLYAYQMIKVIFQPLVENGANHAGKDIHLPVHIQVWGYEEKEDLIFVVSDNGNGMDKQYLEELRLSLDDVENTRYGIGLKNIHRRIRLYYGDHYGLVINSSPGRGTSVTVRIPKMDTISESHAKEDSDGTASNSF